MGFISAPSGTPKGKILSNGLEMNNKKRRKHATTNEIIPIVWGYKVVVEWFLNIKKNKPHKEIIKTQRNSEPSCALHIEVTL